MKIVLNHSSATPHTIKSTTNTTSTTNTINGALRRRAQAIIRNKAIDAETRAKVRYCLETDDPWLAELVRRVDAGETVITTVDLQIPETCVDDTGEEEIKALAERIERLAEMICQAGDDPAVALLVLMSLLENGAHPKALANLAKHFVFTRCGELNLNGMVDAQVTVFESELFAM
jgi:hypothetical protein